MRRFFKLNLRQQRWFVKAWLLFLKWHLKISVTHYELWRSEIAYYPESGSVEEIPQDLIAIIEMAGRNHITKMNCLRRCVVTKEMLKHYGIAPHIHFGVRHNSNQFEAHCWLSLNHQLLNDSSENIETFTELELQQAKRLFSSN